MTRADLSNLSSSSSTSSLLPPPIHGDNKRRRTKKGYQKKQSVQRNSQRWRGGSIPDRIPSLSEVIKNSDQQAKLEHQSVSLVERTHGQENKGAKGTNTTISAKSSTFQAWKAGYYTSIKSQKVIKDAATSSGHRQPLQRATAVLETFLSISPTKLNGANLVCALTLSAKVMGRDTNPKFRSLLYRMNEILQQMLEQKLLSARQLCNVAWALAKFYDRDAELLPGPPEQTALSSDEQLGRAETWDLRNDLVGCPAKRVDETIDEIAVQLTAILDKDVWNAKEGELSMASWAYGILRRRRRPPGWQHGPQLSKLPKANDLKAEAGSDLMKFEQWGPQDNAVEACHTLDESCPAGVLFDMIGRALCEPVRSIRELDEEYDPAVVSRRLEQCKWSELANVAWAFASHGRSCSEDAQNLLMAISSEGSRRLRENGDETKLVLSRDIAQIIWSLGTLQADNYRLGDSHVQFVDAVADYYSSVNAVNEPSNSPFRNWNCPDIVQVALSLAHSRLDMLPMLQSLYAEALNRLNADELGSRADMNRKSFLAWEISVLLWAQARFHLTAENGDVFDSFARQVAATIGSAMQGGSLFREIGIGPQEQANIAWSLTVLELYDCKAATSLLGAIFSEAASSCDEEGTIQLEHAHQLWQSLYLLEDECPSCVEAVPAWFRNYLSEKWNLEKARRKISSARHRALSKTLALMGVDHYNEHDEDIDVAIVLKPDATWTHETETSSVQEGVRVAVEFDGPAHFTRIRMPEDGSKPEPPRALGHTVLKYRLLKKQGWTVVRVPFYEFDKIPFWASMERQRYLQRLLKTHGNLKFSTVDVSEYKAPVANRQSRFD